jgi:hypothetical protein
MKIRRALRAVCLIALAITASGMVAAQQRTDTTLRLKSGTFDPLQSGSRKAAAAGPGWSIVQFQHALTRAERTTVQKKYGLRLTDYIPNFAYLERLDAQTAATLGSDPLVRWIGAYTAEYKVDPSIGKQRFRTKERQAMSGVWLRLVLFKDAAPQPVADAAKKLGGTDVKVLDDRKLGGAVRVQVVMPDAAAARTLAERPEVRWIE